jgi:hypothetical protein
MTLPLFPSLKPVNPPHTCHARGCDAPVPPERLMCIAHWRRVPVPIQRAVWRTYRPGQCNDKQPSEAWMQAADAAIGYVAALELKPVRQVEVDALETLRTTCVRF